LQGKKQQEKRDSTARTHSARVRLRCTALPSPCRRALPYTAPHRTAHCTTELHRTALHCAVLQTALPCTAPHHWAPRCTALPGEGKFGGIGMAKFGAETFDAD